MKHFLSVILSLLLLLQVFCMPAFAVGEDALFTIGKMNAKVGDTVEVPVSASMTKEANSFAFSNLSYDTSALKFIDFGEQNAVPTNTLGTFDKDMKIAMLGLGKAPEILSGMIFTLKFEILSSGAKEGTTYEISMKSLVKNNSTVLTSAVTAGAITVDAPAAHEHTGGKATCVSKAVCSECGEEYGAVNANNHVGGTEVKNAVAATETTDGYTGDTVCKSCGVIVAAGKVIPAFGGADVPKVVIGDVSGLIVKNTITVPVSIVNNPGIINMMLDISYDTSALKLIEIEDTGLLPGQMHSSSYEKIPYRLTWANDTAEEDFYVNGVIVNLTFEILTETAGEYIISAAVPFEDGIMNFDLEPVEFIMDSGVCTIKDYILGDVNGDMKVSATDRSYLARYLAGWDGYTLDKMIFEAADINGDGKLTATDRTYLARHLAGWAGYEDLLSLQKK